MTYTQMALLGVAAAVVADLAIFRVRLITRRGFWAAYAIVVSFQLLTNAWLTNDVRTGMAIVNYDSHAIMGLRIAYAPVEDLLFGFAMVLSTLTLWVFWGARSARRNVSRKSDSQPSPR